MTIHYLNQRGTVRISPDECKKLLVTDWKTRQFGGRSFRHLAKNDYQPILDWLESLEGREPFQIVVFCRSHRRKLPRRFSEEARAAYEKWRALQYQMEGLERGEDMLVDDSAREVHDWQKFVNFDDLKRLVPNAASPDKD